MDFLVGMQNLTRCLMVFGPHGAGKSTFAASGVGKKPKKIVLLDTEGGLNALNVVKTPRVTSMAELATALQLLTNTDQKYDWLGIDSVDWLERIFHRDIAMRGQKKSIGDFEWGAGYAQALEYWDKFLDAMDKLRKDRGCNIVMIAHSKVQTIESPTHPSYGQYQPNLHRKASARLQEYCDDVLYASIRTFVRTEDQGFGKKRNIGSSTSERILTCTESAGVQAKNRLDLPAEIKLDWEVYQQAIDAKFKN